MSGLDLAKRVGLTRGECKTVSELFECKAEKLEQILCEKISGGIFVAWQIQSII